MTSTREEIAHLDFPVEETPEEPEPRHYSHPTDPTICWCGAPANGVGYGRGQATSSHPDEITCVGCLHQYIDKGSSWWWDVHRVYYRTTCSPGRGHSCNW